LKFENVILLKRCSELYAYFGSISDVPHYRFMLVGRLANCHTWVNYLWK